MERTEDRVPFIEIRPIRDRDELESCYDLWANVFPDGRAFFQRRLDYDSSYVFETTWAAHVDGVLAAAIQIFPYQTAVGDRCLTIGGIGNVATLPQYRRMGLAQAILRAQLRWMKASDYDASLLFTGIHSFYEQLGWERMTVQKWHLRPAAVASAEGTSTTMVRRFTEQDLPALMQIYDAWSGHRPQARIRSQAYWRDSLRWLPDETWVAERNGRVLAYLRARVKQERVFEVRELCALPDIGDATASLLVAAVHSHPEVTDVEMMLPEDHPLITNLRSWGASSQLMDSMMWKTLDSVRLMRRIQPILKVRAQTGLERTTRIRLECPDGDILLIAGPDGIDTVDPGSEELTYHHSVRVGKTGLVEYVLYGAPPTAPDVLKILFPRQPGLLWPSDFF
jgi:predicted acetyltransferase